MSKTKPIGVRFDEDMLRVFKEDGIADSPQKVLNFLSAFYLRNRHHENGGFNVTELFRGVKLEKHKEEAPKQFASTTPPRTKIETPKEVIVKEITPVQSDDLFERFRGIKIFRIEEFTKFPDKEKPIDKIKAVEWMILKKVDDKKIRDQWSDFLKNKTN